MHGYHNIGGQPLLTQYNFALQYGRHHHGKVNNTIKAFIDLSCYFVNRIDADETSEFDQNSGDIDQQQTTDFKLVANHDCSYNNYYSHYMLSC